MTWKSFTWLFLIVIALTLSSCIGTAEVPDPITIIKTVEVPVGDEGPSIRIRELDLWQTSGHADSTSEAFRHWDQDDPLEVPKACAKCHSEYGYLDFIGADDTPAGVVDRTASVYSVISCYTCHNDVTEEMTSVVMPSGVEIDGLGDEARCMQCHQGRQSTVSVDAEIAEVGVGDDTVSEELSFLNIHYYAAAATKYGTEAKGGYEYEGKVYDAFFVHIEGYEACDDCHDPHTLEIEIEECTACHAEVESVEDLRSVRMPGSLVDYDGDGNQSEGMYYEILGMREMLFSGILTYAAENVGMPIVYDSHTYPYFFVDTNGDGEIEDTEAAFENRYVSWTPRLLRAAYNYQVSVKDPGAYAHGGKYIIQLLWESIADLNKVLNRPLDLASTNRNDHGHFAGSEEAFRHWDEDEPAIVPGSCSRCHTAAGVPLYLEQGISINQPPSNGLLCSSCHDDFTDWSRYAVDSVTFPSGITVDSGDPDMNLCMTCHQGRQSGANVQAALAGLAPDVASSDIGFINIHYFPAGATIYGSDSGAGFEYPGRTYVGQFIHAEPLSTADSCAECHDAHMLEVEYRTCTKCHTEVEDFNDLQDIRATTVGFDFDGDGDATEGLANEVKTLRSLLYEAIQAYASNQLNAPIVYESHTYPYFFADTNGDGKADSSEASYGNRYSSWSPRLLQAAYNYQYASKDPGAFAHNGQYIVQLLYDSVMDLGGDLGDAVRP